MLEDMYVAMQRIHEIRKRFGVGNRPAQAAPDGAFQSQVDSRVKENGYGEAVSRATAPEKPVSGGRDIAVSDINKLANSYARGAGVPGDLVTAVIRAESSYNPRAVSGKGARGLMQLMPAAGEAMGVRDYFSPEENIRAGVGILRKLLDKYGWDYKKALAAYNAGENAVDENGGMPPYDETRDYISRVIGYYLQNTGQE